MAYELAGLLHQDIRILWPTPEQATEILEAETFDTSDIEAYLAIRVGDEICPGDRVEAIRCDWHTKNEYGSFIFKKPDSGSDNLEQAKLFLAGMEADENWAYDSLGKPE